MDSEPAAPTTDERLAELENEALRRRKLQRMAGFFGVVATAMWALWVFAVKLDLSAVWRSAVALLAAVMVVSSVATLRYLQPASASQKKPASRGYVDQQLSIFARRMGAARAAPVPLEAREETIAQLKAELREGLAGEMYNEVHAALRSDLPLASIARKTEQMERRLAREILDLGHRGNVNLVLGMLTTMIGLLVLGYAVVAAPPAATAADLLLHFLLRLSFAVLIEVFAYFFLRLYKQSLAEIKYFQNELTNIESRSIATQLAVHSDEPALLAEMTRMLGTTERNFVLRAGETTVELERERLTQKDNEKLLAILDHAVKSKAAK